MKVQVFTDFRKILLSLRAMLERILLAPYYLTLKIRHALYDNGVKKVYTCEVPTICVGNIAAGGTGKTPHTEMILRTLLESVEWKDKNIAVLSRGHKRNSSGFQQILENDTAKFAGDEPLQIKNRFPEVTVAVDRTRVEGCDFLLHPEKLLTSRKARKCAHKEINRSDLIVLDDAFQYRSLKAFYNIVLVDYNRPPCKDRLLPFGRLRDLPERLYHANVIIVTKCPAYMEDWERVKWSKKLGIKDFNPDTCQGIDPLGKPMHVFFTTIEYCPLEPVFKSVYDNRYIYSKKLILVSGIASDTPLKRFLSDSYSIVKHFKFSDHHNYSGMDIKRIAVAAKNWPTAVVGTTEKDSQRLRGCKKVPENLQRRMFQIPIKVDFLSDHERSVFNETLLGALREFQD